MLEPRTRRLINGVIIVMILAMGITLAIGLLNRHPEGVEFTIIFKDAQGITVGSPVMLHGLRVGEVTRAGFGKEKDKVEVDVRIDAAFRGEIPAPPGVTARIKKSMLLPGNYSISLIRNKNAQGLMPQGARIEGVETWAGEKTFTAKGAVKRAYRAAVEKTTDKIAQVKEWWAHRKEKDPKAANDEEVEKLLDDLENLDEEQSQTAISDLHKRALEMAKKRAAQGKTEEARRLEGVAQAIEEYEKAASQEEPEATPVPAKTRRSFFPKRK